MRRDTQDTAGHRLRMKEVSSCWLCGTESSVCLSSSPDLWPASRLLFAVLELLQRVNENRRFCQCLCCSNMGCLECLELAGCLGRCQFGLSIICCSICWNLTESLLETISPSHVHTGWTYAADQDVLQWQGNQNGDKSNFLFIEYSCAVLCYFVSTKMADFVADFSKYKTCCSFFGRLSWVVRVAVQ